MGSVSEGRYSVPEETRRILQDGILNNSLLPPLPKEMREAIGLVQFVGNPSPSIPISWRFAESIAALKGFEAAMLNVLRVRKYPNEAKLSKVEINTDHASLFIMSPFVARIVQKNGDQTELNLFPPGGEKYGFPNTDIHGCGSSLHRVMATSIYRTKDGRYYQTHGSMNTGPTLTALGMPLDGVVGDKFDAVVQRFQKVISQIDSHDLDHLMNEQYKQAGTICWTADEYKASQHGKANAHISLYELKHIPNSGQAASWWPENPSLPSSPRRPLAGLKVIDLCRVIAAPAITRSLAEMGASVMRVTGPKNKLADRSGVHQDLNWGKWNCTLDLKDPKDRKVLQELIKDADVVVSGYRPGAMERNGFGREDIFELVKDRKRGIIHVLENCYGWQGPWMHRSGWQQISDAVTGVSMAYGRAMGRDEAVVPVFPNSDYCTGVAGAAGVLHALIRQAEEGGSFGVDSSLNYYSQWLVENVGEYPADVWSDVFQRHGSPEFRHYHNMPYLLRNVVALLQQHDRKTMFNPEFFEIRPSKAAGQEFHVVKPVARFVDEPVDLCYNVGTRTNGVDQPMWPKDLTTEIVGGTAPYKCVPLSTGMSREKRL